MFSPLKQQNGFSFVETMVAALITGIAMLGFAYMFANARSIANELGTKRMALAQGVKKMESLKKAGYAGAGLAVTLPGAGNAVTYPGTPEALTIDKRAATRIWTVIGVDDIFDGAGPGDADGNLIDYKQVTVTVTWSGRTGKAQSVSLATLIAPE